MQLTIDRFGRVVLPKSMRDNLGLGPGDRLEASEEGDTIVLRPVRDQGFLTDKGGVLVFTDTATGDVEGAVAAHRQERLKRASGWRRGA